MAFNPTIPAYSTQGKSFSRTAAFPLEGYEIWTDLDALKAYAANTDPAKDPSYIGQKIAYIDTENNRVVHYGIEIDGSVRELGPVFGAEDEGKFLTIVKVVDQEASGEEGAEDYQPEISHLEYDWVEIEVENTVTTLTSADNSVTITDTGVDGNHIYDLKVNFPEIEIPEVPEYKIVKDETPTEGSQATYHLTKDDVNVDVAIEIPAFPEIPEQVDYTVTVTTENPEDSNLKHYIFNQCGQEIAHIDIPKDLVVDSGSVIVATTEDVTETNGVVIGETYIKLVIANQEEPIYIAAKDLVDIYTVADTASVDMTITGTEIKADLKISAKEGNSLAIIEEEGLEGLYVNAPILPTVSDTAVENQVVVAVTQTDGAIAVERRQLSYNELADLPTIPTIPDLKINEAVALPAAETSTIAVIAALEETADHEITPKVIDVATKKGLDDLAALVGNKATGEVAATGLYGEVARIDLALGNKVEKSVATADGGLRFINEEEINKLAQLTLEEGGGVAISGTINADNVHGLGAEILEVVTGTGDYISTPAVGQEGDENYVPATIIQKLGIEKGAQVNKIEAVALPDAVLAITDKQVNLPAFADGKYGVIKGAELVSGAPVANQVYANNGVGEVKAVSTDILKNGTEEFIINGGNANVTTA